LADVVVIGRILPGIAELQLGIGRRMIVRSADGLGGRIDVRRTRWTSRTFDEPALTGPVMRGAGV
jgi:hypothetical protein